MSDIDAYIIRESDGTTGISVKNFKPEVWKCMQEANFTHDIHLLVSGHYMEQPGFLEDLKRAARHCRFVITNSFQTMPPGAHDIPEDEPVIWTHYGIDSLSTAGSMRGLIQEIIDRQARGDFTLKEVSNILAAESEVSPETIESDLRRAFVNGELRFYSGKGHPIRPERFRTKDDDDGIPLIMYFGLDGEYTTVNDVNNWLESISARYRFPCIGIVDPDLPAESIVAVPRFQAQEVAILQCLRENNYDPAALPKQENGKRWVKSQIREELLKSSKSIFHSVAVFDKAWGRLNSDGRIKTS